MNTFKYSKTGKKFIIALVMLILFNFCYPKDVKAFEIEDIVAAPARIFWMIEKGVLIFLNNIFSDIDVDGATSVDINGTHVTDLKIDFTTENIIRGRFLLFDANIFKEISDTESDFYLDDGNYNIVGGKIKLRETISGWYYALRNFAIVALLSVLVYVGIRMIISTVSQDKAKYKIMFKDWVVALCLLILMHYLMITILDVTSMITESLGVTGGENYIGKITKNITGCLYNGKVGDGENAYQYVNADRELIELSDVYSNILVLAGIIGYTFIFAVKYLKREFTIIFLILLGPVSCITYPIDKIADGKAQAFNRWFSEFLYQVIIQPFHLLLYIVLVGTATQLANTNIIYTLVCFAVMIPAEKFVKEMFGFKDKLGSPLGALATGAALSSLLKKGFGGFGGSGGGKDKPDDKNASTQPTLSNKRIDEKTLAGTDGKDKEQKDGNQVKQKENPEAENGNQVNQQENPEAEMGDQVNQEENPEAEGGDQVNEEENPEAESDGQRDEEGNPEAATEEDKSVGNSLKNRVLGKLGGLYAVHNQRAAKKWGSTSVRGRWMGKKGRLATLVSRTAKFGVRTAGTVAGAAVLGGAGFMFGKGAAGAVAGAALGRRFANRTITGAAGVASTVKDYYRNGIIGTDKRNEKMEEEALRTFKGDRTQIDKAVTNYRDNHDGANPTYTQLEKEMEDRFALSRYGLDDTQTDKLLGTYQKLIDPEGDYKLDSTQAGREMAYASKLAQQYTPEKLRNEKTMQEALSNITNQFIAGGASQDKAAAMARVSLERAGTLHKVKTALPPETITVTSKAPSVGTVARTMGVEVTQMDTVEVEQMRDITVKLEKAGFSQKEITTIATSCKGGTTKEVLKNYNVKLEYLNNTTAQDEARRSVEIRNNGSQATKAQLRTEMKERVVLSSTFNVKDESKITELRNMEMNSGIKNKSQIQAAREFANKHKGSFNNFGYMSGARDALIRQLTDGGKVSRETATKNARNIINLASQYNNETLVDGVFKEE